MGAGRRRVRGEPAVMGRTIALTVCALLSLVLTVEARRRAMNPRRTPVPYPLEMARPTDGERAAEATGLPGVAGEFTLVSARRSGNDARHLIYRSRSVALSVFATGRRFTALPPARGWTEVSLESGRAAWVWTGPDHLSAVAWLHQGRRCVAVGRLAPAKLVGVVRRLAAGR